MTEGKNNTVDNRKNSYVNIKEYAGSKNVDVHIINGYISAHRAEFAGHIAKDKNAAALDDWARYQLDTYIENRPDKGKRFHRFDRKGSELSMEELNSTKLHEQEDAAYDGMEMGVDVPDLADGTDDRDTVVNNKPSKNPLKARAVGGKHYKVFRQENDEIEDMIEKEKSDAGHKISETKIDPLDIDDFEIESRDSLEK